LKTVTKQNVTIDNSFKTVQLKVSA
jgi:hypothetical protein